MNPSDKGEANTWYIDSIDILGGRAFASRREGPRAPENLSSVEGYFVSPPCFAPEPIGSSATALGAARGVFDAGLFDGDGIEIPFFSLDDIVEFVRRAYSAGGGGEGGGGGPGPPQPPEGQPPDEQPPERPRDSLDGPSQGAFATEALTEALEKFAKFSGSPTKDGGGVRLGGNWPSASIWYGGAAHKDISRDKVTLPYAGRCILVEFLSRAPLDPRDSAASSWFDAAVGVRALVASAGLSVESENHVLGDPHSSIGRAWEGIRVRWLKRGWRGYLEHLPTPMHWILYGFTYRRWLDPIYEGHVPDRFELLYDIPIPAELNSLFGSDPRPLPSLGSLLSLVLAAPLAAWSPGVNTKMVMSLCLLASAFLVVTDRPRGRLMDYGGMQGDDLVRDAYEWMSANMPKVAFRPDLESKIESAATLRLRRVSAGTASE